jgi:hypothetical protein
MIVQTCVMVTNTMLYGVLVEDAILYPLGINLEFWE